MHDPQIGKRYVYVFTIAGFIGLLNCFKTFKYFAVSKKMNALWVTLANAAPDLLAFMVGFLLLVSGFAFLGTLLYGPSIVDFHNFPSAFSPQLHHLQRQEP